jgi:hypothetical protein
MDRPLLLASASLALLFVGAAAPRVGSASVYTIGVSGGT